MSRRQWLSLIPLVAALAACGGGGGFAGLGTTTNSGDADVSAVAKNDPGSPLPATWKQGPFAEIYVRGYKDSDGDGIGDLKGLTQQLDYLQQLGVTGIWLMPVTQSQDNDHGYAVTDYRAIEKQYGSLADFDAFIKAAHDRGIGVIIDYVMNHSGAKNPLFINSSSATDSTRRNWYIWQSTKPSGWSIYGSDPWKSSSTGYYFAGFWDQMPDFNLRNADVIAYHQNSMRFWLNRGVDGFRFDAVGNLVENGPNAWEGQPENYTIMGDVHTMLGGYANRYMVCEAPIDPVGFSASTACGSAFAFGHNYDIVSAAKGSSTSAVTVVANYFSSAPLGIATMVSNHDAFAGDRLWTQVNGDQKQYRLAAATYLLQPGVPFIYYGEEIGMANNSSLSGDWKLRTPMSWTSDSATAGFTSGTPFRALSSNSTTNNVAAQQADANSLLNFYKAVIAMRKAHPALASGSYDNPQSSGLTMSFTRSATNEMALVAINYGTSAANVNFTGLPASASVAAAWPASGVGGVATTGGTFSATVPAQSFVVFTIAK
ncbi:alpha-amylase family glycosyl hydrolase [Niveibacterium umoris]|uniref:Glycosidase n=1 Tax=Niveibacterium umoris TaxID=1193620 RepID=A0A840BLJ5_9RHOO|nr:alpha-amylase family glycosyl hydrolase [Niveibacterium umoris]MBB4014115.1 glycosidase [Niveibacterium umoris]